MRNRFRRTMLSLMLSALVLAWGIVPPVVQHAHVGGNDTSHQHGNRPPQTVPHHASHEHDSDAERHEHSTVPEDSLLADFVSHLHWQFFGMDFSMPVPEEPGDDTDDEGTVPPMVVRVMDEVVPATQAGPSLCRVLCAAICTPTADVVWTLTPAPRSPSLVTSIPLCDSARLERSGVLLA